jgi:hypothetical protein
MRWNFAIGSRYDVLSARQTLMDQFYMMFWRIFVELIIFVAVVVIVAVHTYLQHLDLTRFHSGSVNQCVIGGERIAKI